MPKPAASNHVRVSKLLSSILRHRAVDLKLPIREDGYVPLEAVLALPSVKRLGAKFALIADVVNQNAKQRFSLQKQSDGSYWIRANQGHSIALIQSEKLLTQIRVAAKYPHCIHGTYYKAWGSILRTGLSRMKRKHIHFSSKPFLSTETISGMRNTCEVLVHVDMARAMADGIPFYVSSNQVILTEGLNGVLPPRYIATAFDARTGKALELDPRVASAAIPAAGGGAQKTTESSSARPSEDRGFDFLAVLDFEATCVEERDRNFTQEIIEWPCVLLNATTGETVDVFHHYIKPRQHPQLSTFCKNLTKIEQATVDAGIDIEETMDRFSMFLRKHQLVGSGSNAATKRFAFVTCGDWDLKTMLPRQCKLIRRAVPAYARSWINIKHSFQKQYKVKAGGMAGMLRHLKMPLVGTHHSGIDDSKNIAAIAVRMLRDGHRFQPTTCTQKRGR
jgi:RNA:NAD 2'-phosphotransferase (TPT1/KptA family)/inhibitor of KinA sporulation pathway (predicted exonuclease)